MKPKFLKLFLDVASDEHVLQVPASHAVSGDVAVNGVGGGSELTGGISRLQTHDMITSVVPLKTEAATGF